jgi:hypothetical protein
MLRSGSLSTSHPPLLDGTLIQDVLDKVALEVRPTSEKVVSPPIYSRASKC